MSSIVDFYDPYLYDLGVGDADVSDTVAYYRDAVGTVPARILDIGAGMGRFAIPLAEAGHDVLALDHSAKMLEALERRAAGRPLLGTLGVSLRSFGKRSGESPADIAVAPDDFLLHLLSAEDLAEFFRDLPSWLPNGGRFITDIRPREHQQLAAAASSPHTVRSFPVAEDPLAPDSRRYVHCSYFERYDPTTQRLDTTCQYQLLDSDGEVSRAYIRVLEQRIHMTAEIRHAAALSGIELVAHTKRNRVVSAREDEIGGSYEFLVPPPDLREPCR